LLSDSPKEGSRTPVAYRERSRERVLTDKPENKPIERLGRIIRIEIRTRAKPEQAYDAWAGPEKIAHWFPDRAEGRAEPGATITWIFDKFDYRIPYEVLIAQPARKFAGPVRRRSARLPHGILSRWHHPKAAQRHRRCQSWKTRQRGVHRH
jgi:hypothetical protein